MDPSLIQVLKIRPVMSHNEFAYSTNGASRSSSAISVWNVISSPYTMVPLLGSRLVSISVYDLEMSVMASLLTQVATTSHH